ncbi:PTB-containing, cubilin and LRP1-interacting protein isoform X5 [Paramormyrops kingsleyae]|uniref:PTB-containing, cubilin and LRP1-interacting protein isoform X5 n=1 Tax=Paramormyrops kingsleyae TaxID=1676925 RepID=UPI003B975FDF
MWQPATERLQHFQTMLKTKLNVLTLKKEPLPTVIFHEPEAIELRSTTPLMKTRTHMGYKVTYLGKVTITGTQFLSGCTESAVIGLWERRALVQDDVLNANAILEIRPFQINDDLTFQMDCHAVECEGKLEAKKLAHAMMEAFRKTFQSMRSDGRIHKSSSSDEFPEDFTPEDG